MSYIQQYEYLFKVVVLGASGVGKTLLQRRFAEPERPVGGYSCSIGCEFATRLMPTKPPCKLQVWDTCGQERFHSLTRSYYRHADAVLLCYDLSKPEETLGQLDGYLQDALHYCSPLIYPTMILVGCKSDLVEETELGIDEKDFECEAHFKTSSKAYTNIEEVFAELTTRCMKRMERPRVLPLSVQVRGSTSARAPGSGWQLPQFLTVELFSLALILHRARITRDIRRMLLEWVLTGPHPKILTHNNNYTQRRQYPMQLPKKESSWCWLL